MCLFYFFILFYFFFYQVLKLYKTVKSLSLTCDPFTGIETWKKCTLLPFCPFNTAIVAILRQNNPELRAFNPQYVSLICSVFFVSKGNLFDVYFTTLQLVLVPCGGGRTSLRTLP